MNDRFVGKVIVGQKSAVDPLLPFEGAGPLAYKQSFRSRVPAGQAGLQPDEGHGGAVTLIQRFRSAANLTMGERIGAAELRQPKVTRGKLHALTRPCRPA